MKSQNGWDVASQADIHYYAVPGTTTTVAVRTGAVAVVFTDLFEQLAKIEKPHTGWLWGWYVRPIRGQTTGYSNHASGTAIDWNAPAHGRQSTSRYLGWSAAQVTAIHNLLHDRYEDLIRWGADFKDTPYDPMHFEIVGTPAQISALAAKLVVVNNTPKPPIMEGMNDVVAILSRKDEAEQYLSDGMKRRWIIDKAHRDLIVEIFGAKVWDIFSATDAGMNAVGGPLEGPESPDKVARQKAGQP